MRYYLSTLLDKQTRDYVRDVYRKLNKFKSSLDMAELDTLHFNYKYLGKDISTEVIQEIEMNLSDLVKSAPMHAFQHPLQKIKWGGKLEYMPSTFRIELKRTPELNELFRLLHITSAGTDSEEVIRKKDPNTLLGVIKIAEIRTNLKMRERKTIEGIIAEIPAPPAITVDNFSIIGTDYIRNKFKQRLVSKINLPVKEL